MEKRPDEIYVQLWKLVGGAVRDTFASHPEYLTEAGRRAAERSIVKRVTGTLHGYATQVARGRSAGMPDVACDAAANGPTSFVSESGQRSGFHMELIRWARTAYVRLGGAVTRHPKFTGPHRD